MNPTSVNFWFEQKCARVFWDQRAAVPYQELLQDTLALADVRPGDRWLDLGCGSGQLTAGLWVKSRGRLSRIVGLDCAEINAEEFERLPRKLTPHPRPEQLLFRVGDFSQGLPGFDAGAFDGVISGLAISYAESQDPVGGRFTDDAYNRLLAELHRVLRPGGQLVFSVNVPEPRFWSIFWRSLRSGFRAAHVRRIFINTIKMQSYGRWLKREARKGRFHFLHDDEITLRLASVGFTRITSRLSYADQAYVFRAEKP